MDEKFLVEYESDEQHVMVSDLFCEVAPEGPGLGTILGRPPLPSIIMSSIDQEVSGSLRECFDLIAEC